jgi:8-oxo-dGTP pyrophosphatase MutT (NUDIX family)
MLDLAGIILSCSNFMMLTKRDGKEFLLMKHENRYDLPKGHAEVNETELETALRETQEETGIQRDSIQLIDDFRFEDTYYPTYKRFGGETVQKTLVIFLGKLKTNVKVVLTEHPSYRWMTWHPPHTIQKNTIDPLLAAVDKFLQTHTL